MVELEWKPRSVWSQSPCSFPLWPSAGNAKGKLVFPDFPWSLPLWQPELRSVCKVGLLPYAVFPGSASSHCGQSGYLIALHRGQHSVHYFGMPNAFLHFPIAFLFKKQHEKLFKLQKWPQGDSYMPCWTVTIKKQMSVFIFKCSFNSRRCLRNRNEAFKTSYFSLEWSVLCRARAKWYSQRITMAGICSPTGSLRMVRALLGSSVSTNPLRPSNGLASVLAHVVHICSRLWKALPYSKPRLHYSRPPPIGMKKLTWLIMYRLWDDVVLTFPLCLIWGGSGGNAAQDKFLWQMNLGDAETQSAVVRSKIPLYCGRVE